jgi:hypothetical protein
VVHLDLQDDSAGRRQDCRAGQGRAVGDELKTLDVES